MTATYTTQLAAGLGMLEETRAYLALWQDGMNGEDLYRTALASGRFPNISARRLHDSITVGFAPRFLRDGGRAARLLHSLQDSLTKKEFDQLLYLYTCRAHAILTDFICEFYWEAYRAGKQSISNDESLEFVNAAVQAGKTTTNWSDTIIRRAASNLTGCCANFGLLEAGQRRERKILSFRIEPTVAAILAYDLHFGGQADNQVVHHKDWMLFGMEPVDVLDELKRLSLRGYFIVQAAAGVAHIGWQYKTEEELAHAIARG